MIRVVIADDQAVVCAGLALLLETDSEIEVVATVGDGRAAVDATIRHEPDVVLMDVRMPGLDGVEATRQILDRRARCGTDESEATTPAVLMLTTYDVDEAVYGALRAGASGFLLKDAAPADLTRAIRAIAAGGGWLAPAITRRIIERVSDRPLGVVPRDSRLDLLTAREVEVLQLIARGLSNTEIAELLVIGEGTVKTHVSHLLAKLQLRDRAQAAVFAYTARLVDP